MNTKAKPSRRHFEARAATTAAPGFWARLRRLPIARVTTTFALLVTGSLATAAAGERRPVPAMTIYPGDVIRAEMLTSQDFTDGVSAGAFASTLTMLVGKAARRTLLPGQPIPVNAVAEPKVVKVGAMVRLVFEEDGLQIVTYASALQAGAAGDLVAVRNLESGVTVSGVVHSDGSIHIGPG